MAALSTLVLATPAVAWCDNDLTRPAYAAAVAGGARAYFVKGSEISGCPSTAPACRARAYVVAGDTVVVTADQGPYACATLTNPRGVSTSSWLETAALSPLVPAQITREDWLGKWKTGEQDLSITKAPGARLTITGDATYGTLDPERVRRGAVNMGSVSSVAEPAGNSMHVTDLDNAECRIDLKIVGPYLVAANQGECGGLGVSFSGVYRRMR